MKISKIAIMMACMCSAPTMFADVTVNFKQPAPAKSLIVSHASVQDMLNARRESDLKPVTDTIAITGTQLVFPLSNEGDTRYRLELTPELATDFYARPGENIVVDFLGYEPLKVSVTGTPLMEGMTEIEALAEPIEKQAREHPDQMQQLYEAYNKVFVDYIKQHPESPAAAYAILNVSPENFMECYEAMGEGARSSLFAPFVAKTKERVERTLEQERLQREMASGHTLAPNFSLPDINGKTVTLDQFRGKWVILDFWGSWCVWCVKGFPALKEAYAKYAGELEVIGIDCGEPMEAWRNAVERFKLPWVNVYNADGPGSVDKAYAVQGFPTKVIVNPQGVVVDITTGEDPEFFDKLAGFIGK